MKFRKKPVVIEAHNWDGTFTCAKEINRLFPEMINVTLEYTEAKGNTWIIKTLEGQHIVSPGDWIIRGVKGEYYPCKPDIFDMTHEPVIDSTP